MTRPSRWRRAFRRLSVGPWPRVFGVAFLLLVLGLVSRQLVGTDWNAVWRALQARPAWLLTLIALVALTSHALYACLDVIGRGFAHHRLSRWRTWWIAMVSYAFNLNLGALVGGVAFRYRLYRREGVSLGATALVIATSISTNWMGLLFLVATLPLWEGGTVVSHWLSDRGAYLLALGVAAIVALFLYGCAKRWVWRFAGRALHFPPLRPALLQCAIGSANWCLMGAVLRGALAGTVPYGEALTALLIAAIAGAIVHVPGGWGVLEFVLIMALTAPRHELIAGALVYRAAYYLLPLALAATSLLASTRWREHTTVPLQRSA